MIRSSEATSAGPYRLGELARRLGAQLHGGNPDGLIRAVAGIEEAGAEDVTFVANPRYARLARSTHAGAVLVEPGFGAIDAPTLRTPEPYLAFARAIELFYRPPAFPPGIAATAAIAASAVIGENAHIGAYAVVMDGVVLGRDATILPHTVIYPHAHIGNRLLMHSHAVIREYSRLGDDVVLQNGAVIGADGFGFAPKRDRSWHKIVQSGRVVLEDRVEVQAHACVDRASIGETRIGSGSKIDNLVQIGHGSTVGRNSLICAQAGLAGSTRVGDRVILAGQVGVAGHCTIGDDVVVTAQSGVPSDVEAGRTVSGYPALDNRRWLRTVAALNQLPELIRSLRDLKKNL